MAKAHPEGTRYIGTFSVVFSSEKHAGFYRSFVELDSYFVEGLVKIASLTDDDYYYYEKEYLIKGLRHGRKFRLGDNVRVTVARINAFRNEIDFELSSLVAQRVDGI